MARARRIFGVTAAAALAGTLGITPARAGAPLQISISPSSGPPGTVITVALPVCDSDSASARIELISAQAQVVADTGFFAPAPVDAMGLGGTITVPAGAPGGSYLVRGTCNNQPPPGDTDTEPFQVTGTGPATTTTTVAPGQPSPVPTPVETEPAFTG